jgi:hypothetical protein
MVKMEGMIAPNVKKACGTWLGTYALLSVATALVVYRRIPEAPVAAICGLIGGGIALVSVAYFAGIAKKIRKARMIRRGFGDASPEDGAKIAAIGRIGTSGAGSLTSPLSKTACVAYKYEIRSGYGEDEIMYYDGFAMTPSAIQGRQRTTRLLAWGDLQMSWQTVPASIAQANAEEYIGATEFREPALLNFRKSIADIAGIYKDDDGSVRWDQRGLRPPLDAGRPLNLQTAGYREWLVRPGDFVCVIGRYSTERGGIVPSDHPLIDPVTIEVGEESAFARRASAGAAGYFIGGAIFLAIFLAGLLVLHASVPLDAVEQHNPSMVASWTEIRLERLLDRSVRPHMPAGLLSSGNYVIVLPRGSANGRVSLGEHDRVVARAAMRRNGDERIISIDDNAVALTIDEKGHPLRLALLGRDVAVRPSDVEIKENGNDEVAGRVTFVTDDANAPVCRVTFRASTN